MEHERERGVCEEGGAAACEAALEDLPVVPTLEDLAARLLGAKKRMSDVGAELLARLEAPTSGDVRRLEVVGLGKIAYVSPSEADAIDGRASARKLVAAGAAFRTLREGLRQVVERLADLRALVPAELAPWVEGLGEQLEELTTGEVDDEIPTTHSTRKASLRVTLAGERSGAGAAAAADQ